MQTRDFNASHLVTTGLLLVGAAALGAGLMFLMDPQGGGRRRALIRDKTRRYTRQTQTALRKQAQQVRDKARGLASEARAALRSHQVDDQTLCERVRSALGRVVTHPSSIQVEAVDGLVTLSGPILVHEVDELIETVSHVRGVQDVIHNLDEHETSENVPGLQGRTSRISSGADE
jgi:hypothetical protein